MPRSFLNFDRWWIHQQSLDYYLSSTGLVIVSLEVVTNSNAFLRFLQTMGIARAQEPNQIKLFQDNQLGRIWSSPWHWPGQCPFFIADLFVFIRNVSKMSNQSMDRWHRFRFPDDLRKRKKMIYVVQNCMTHPSKCSSTKPLSEYIEFGFEFDNESNESVVEDEPSAMENSWTSSRICRNSLSNSRHKLDTDDLR